MRTALIATFCTASFQQGRLKVTFRYFLPLLDSLKTIALSLDRHSFPSQHRQTHYARLQLMVIECFTVVSMVWLFFLFVHSFPFARFFCCCYIRGRSFHFGFAYDQSKFAFDCNTSRDYKRLREGNIFFIPPSGSRTL